MPFIFPLGVNRPEQKADKSPPFNKEIRHEWKYTSITLMYHLLWY
jgi:hypothetical protein